MAAASTDPLIKLAADAREHSRREKAQRRRTADALVDLLLERAEARQLLRRAADALGRGPVRRAIIEHLEQTE